MPLASKSTGITITNPLVLYRTLVATKRIAPDPEQHRLAIHLQKLYENLKDYEPIVQYGHRLQQISRALGNSPGRSSPSVTNDSSKASANTSKLFSSLFEEKKSKDTLAMTRVLTSHQAALELDSPKGLMLHGEVGTGKSMLIDLFADCLPNKKKKRMHYSTFMLDTLGKLEHLRRSRQLIIPTSLGQQDDYSLLWLARDMISTSPILFLDEFQLPDRAAAKIVTNLMTCFFHLGGVLVATSNRMPEELSKASGMEFAAPPPTEQSFLRRTFGLRSSILVDKSDRMFSQRTEFTAFLDVLRARCEVWNLASGQDYRRRDSKEDQKFQASLESNEDQKRTNFEGLEPMIPGNIGLGYEQSTSTTSDTESPEKTTGLPLNYFVKPLPSLSAEDQSSFIEQFNKAQLNALQSYHPSSSSTAPNPPTWTPRTLKVYNRALHIPHTHSSGTCQFTFSTLCGPQNPLGPADYLTLASTFHTFILTDVPILSDLQKNEARRLITLLDALYEARCRLLITADAGPDDLFFPDSKTTGPNNQSPRNEADSQEKITQDATYAETFSEAYQDATAPFRPNISSYTSPHPSDQLEDTPPNTPSNPNSDPDKTPNFTQTVHLTGQDAHFATARAVSRLWELCSSRWWARPSDASAPRDAPSWWTPLPREVRRWERPLSSFPETSAAEIASKQEEEEAAHSPFRRTDLPPPPRIAWTHAWGLMRWGRKAGTWGKGVEGLDERRAARSREGEEGQ